MANLKEEVDISKIYGESAKPDKGAFVQKNNIKLQFIIMRGMKDKNMYTNQLITLKEMLNMNMS